MRSFTKSEEEFGRALNVIAEGTTQARTPETLIPGAYPIFAQRGKGAYIWDVDGNKYIDWILSFGTIVLGHSHPVVNAAVVKELEEGFALPLTRVIQTEMAELLVDIVPCADKVLLLKTGSGATSAAVRLARLATGRDRIARLGYNGWHDWCCKIDAGIPQAVLDLTLMFEYNNLDSLAALFEAYPDQIAAVIMWPYEVELPRPGFLEEVRDLAHQHGALFILDEIRTGFHLAMGGAQEYWHIVPDLATLGKALSNGFAISAVVGRDEYMDNVGLSWFSSTFNTNSIDQAAAVATIGEMKKNNVIEHLWRIGQGLMEGLDGLAQTIGIEAKAVGLPPMPFLEFTYDDPETVATAKRVFFSEAIQQGVFFHPDHHWFVSASHGDEELAYTLEACDKSFRAVKKVL
jgi:glutamate-1-semialdehyde 2,1-aminomutase